MSTTSVGSAEVQGDLWSERGEAWATDHEQRCDTLHRAGLAALDVRQGDTLLDLGCGSGIALRLAADRGADVTGLDAAPVLVEHARRRVPGARIEVGDLQFLPFEDDAFDIVTGFNSFQYAADPHDALCEAHRVVKPGGRMLIAVWGPASQCELAPLLGAVGSLLPPPPPGTPGPFALAEEGALSALIDEAGFDTLVVADVTTPVDYPDEATYLRGFGSAGPIVRAVRTVGAETVDRVLLEAGAPYRRADGSYRTTNVFRFAIGRAR